MEGHGAASRSRVLLGVDEARVPHVLLQPQRPQIGAPPRSALLDRLATFLPAMEASNARMARNEPVVLHEDDFATDAAADAAPGEVEMDLYCGVMAAPAADEAPGLGEGGIRLPGDADRGQRPRAGITEL
ncbi:hypothetical protein KFE25_007518 [Diacronema lutheri]|uniref:Uncharacterized protein n=2 Tax=Diacronema lutheri TaxID=2081491 RepID=A0A8J5Y0H2_DIALT|nr:hypothetical protein KFE25_007518 [Diacronema lutheri]